MTDDERFYEETLWVNTCYEVNGGVALRSSRWFLPDVQGTILHDKELCQKAFAEGDERAQKYMLKHLELRMKG